MGADEVLERLIQRAKSGDPVAFEMLARRVHPVLYRWALAWTGDLHDADDVAQEALVKMHQHLDRYEGRGVFTTWLYKVARHATADLHRSRSRERRITEAVRDSTLPQVATDRHDVEDADTIGLVKTFLVKLSPRQREIFDLCDLQGYAPSEVAEMLQLEPPTVRVHLLRARSVIRAEILRHHPEGLERHGS